MTTQRLSKLMQSADDTAACAAHLAETLVGGDVILLQGDVGAGKTHFARNLIQTRLGRAEDVPSPTFTLVQTYALEGVDIWHADLYRLSSVQEIEELGLLDAFETDVCLVEWPDRLGDLAPTNALMLMLTPGQSADTRIMTAEWSDPRWTSKLGILKE